MIDNPAKLQAAGLGLMVKAASGDVIVRMDVHAEYAPDYVRQCVETLERTGADNVGGAQRAKAKNAFQRALCAALASPLAVGGAKYRSADSEGFVETVFLGAYRRKVFETVGLWDPGAITNEDAELNERLLAQGGQIYLSRDIKVHYYPRDSFKTLATQYFKYGRGRARTVLKLRSAPSLRPLGPFLMVAGASTLVALPPLWPAAAAAFSTYALACGAEAVRVGRELGPLSIAKIAAMFPVIHASHGVGFAAGLWRYLRAPDWPEEPERVPPKKTHLRAV
jgi:hypothetical protein